MFPRCALVLVGWGCTVDPSVPPQPPGAAGPARADASGGWWSGVQTSLSAEARAFQPDAEGFVARVGRIAARTEDGALRLQVGGGGYALRTVGFGRGEAAPVRDPEAPVLGACTAERTPGGDCVRRVEQARDGWVEWYATQEGGVEQGWTLNARPDGTGPLVIAVAVEGGMIAPDGEDIAITDDNGGSWTYGGLLAWDATGRSLSAAMTIRNDEVQIAVDDLHAIYPVEIDPVSSAADLTILGNSGGDGATAFAMEVASAGDVNGDGYDDVIVGASDYSASRGRAYIYHGAAGGVQATYDSEADTVLTGAWSSSRFGYSVASAGDVNGDGYGDVIVGSPKHVSYGRAYLFHGGPAGIASGSASTAATTLAGATGKGNFGGKVAGVGDVNGDGYDDIAVSNYITSGHTTSVYLFHGASSGVASVSASSAAAVIVGDVSGDAFGRALASAGDVNRDGYDDLIVGAFNSRSTGEVFFYLGASGGIASAAATAGASAIITGEGASDDLGIAVAPAGDVNADGYDDVVIGASGYATDEGRAYVFLGAASGIASADAGAADVVLSGSTSTSSFGASVASAGDVNADGYGDVIIGASASAGGVASAFVFQGAAGGLATTDATLADATFTEVESGTSFGSAVASAGDVDADGYGDVIVGAYAYLGNTGSAYVFEGSASGLPSVSGAEADAILLGPTEERFGAALAGAVDVDGDGNMDLAVGSPGDAQGAGRVSLFLGTSEGLTAQRARDGDATLSGASEDDRFGASVAWLDDTDGDGGADLLVAAPGYSSSTGRAYVFLGTTDGLSTTTADGADLTLTGETAEDAFGSGAAAAGDLNGDGLSDLAIGAEEVGRRDGRAYVFLGGGVSGSVSAADADAVLESGGHERELGYVIAGAGDLNGDGYDDLAIADTASSIDIQSGAVHLYHGASGGIPSGSVVSADHTIWGIIAYENFGKAVAAAGDVNGDGYDDLAVGARDGLSAYGRVSLFLGASGGISAGSSSKADASVAGTAGGSFGGSIASAGDVNGDGYADLILGDSNADSKNGAAYLFLGADVGIEEGTVDSAAQTWTGDTDSGFGAAVASAGDLNHDGLDDLLIGAPDYESSLGLVQVVVDACEATIAYIDADGDGYGDSASPVETLACEPLPSGHATSGGDCDDSDARISPEAEEVCDELETDEDCDGAGLPGAWTYTDADGDGYGDEVGVYSCEPLEGTLDVGGDCDDLDPSVSPAADELPGDEVDQDCDGAEACYHDDDGDGYRTGETLVSADVDCADPTEAAVGAGEDCDDTDGDISPAAAEIAGDEVDQDCDGGEICYPDLDGDGVRTDEEIWSDDLDCTDAGEAVAAAADGDCDDTNPETYTGAVEQVGDGVDQDCDGGEICFVDLDDDGYRPDETSVVVSTNSDCDDPTEALATDPTGDCDDADPMYHPYAEEADCSDPNDYNCDGSVAYENVDGDAYAACMDCDDTNPDIYPGATEQPGDEVDQDCDGGEICFQDTDDDTYRPDETSTLDSADLSCDDPGEALSTDPTGDCDDTSPEVYPGAPEVIGDGTDGDCDGEETCGLDQDADADGYGVAGEVSSDDLDCADPGERPDAVTDPDCDDTNPDIYPDAPETPADGVDQDCDGGDLCYLDHDDDGYRPDDTSTVSSTDLACDASGEAVSADPTGDCDDDHPAVYPGAPELMDGLDNDCDGHNEDYDSDGDGLSDGAEAAGGTDPHDPDTDGGGKPDGQEIEEGRDPLNAGDDDDKEEEEPRGCTCAAPPSRATLLPLALLALALARRRQRRA